MHRIFGKDLFSKGRFLIGRGLLLSSTAIPGGPSFPPVDAPPLGWAIEYQTATLTNSNISSSAYASKGNILSVAHPRLLTKVAGFFTAGQTVQFQLAEVTAAAGYPFETLIRQTDPVVVSALGIVEFDVDDILLDPAKRYAFLFTRTDAGDTGALATRFPGANAWADAGGFFSRHASVLIAQQSFTAGDNLEFAGVHNVAMRVYTDDLNEFPDYVAPNPFYASKADTATYLSDISDSTSASNYASKGEAFRVTEPRVLTRFGAKLKANEEVVARLVEIDRLTNYPIKSVVWTSAPVTPASTTAITYFDVTDTFLDPAKVYGVIFTRTGADAAAPLGVGFLGKTAAYDDVVRGLYAIRYASNAPTVGDNTLYDATTNVQVWLDHAAVSATGSVEGTHQYWRVRFPTAPSGVFPSLRQISFHDDLNGADLTSPADAATKAIYSSQFNGTSYAAVNAFDDVEYGDPWGSSNVSGANANSWLGWNFGTGNEKAIRKIVITGANEADRCPVDAVIEHSDDGTNWTASRSLTGLGMLAGDTRALYVSALDTPQDPGVSARYWRAVFSAPVSDTSYLGVNDLDMFDGLGNSLVNRAERATRALAGNQFSSGSYSRALAFDGDDTNWWLSVTTAGRLNNWLGWDFGAPVEVERIRLKGAPQIGRMPLDLKMQRSDDGTTWFDAWDHGVLEGPSTPNVAGAVFDSYRDPADVPALVSTPEATHWRIVFDSAHGNNYAGFSNISFADTVDGADLTSPAEAAARAFAGCYHSGSFSPDKAFNDNVADNWLSGSNLDDGAYIGWRFDTPRAIVEAAVVGPDNGSYGMVSGRVEKSNDGAQWVTAWTIDAQPAWGSREARVLTDPAALVVGTAHRYWRLRFPDSVSATYIRLAEVQFRDTVGGPDLTTPADAATRTIGSSELDATTNAKVNVFDDTTTTSWSTANNGDANGWIGWDFGLGNEKDIKEALLRGDNLQERFPLSASLEYSDNGTDWSIKRSVGAFDHPTANDVRVIRANILDDAVAPGAAARYWRVLIPKANDNTYMEVKALEMFATPGGASLINTADAQTRSIFSTERSGIEAYKAFDGSAATYWRAEHSYKPNQYIGWDFGTPTEVQQFALTCNDAARSPYRGILQKSDDGIHWYTVFGTVAQTGWALDERRVFTDPAKAGNPAIGARRFWRVRMPTISVGNAFMSLSKVEMATTVGGADVTGVTGNVVFSTEYNTSYAASKAFDSDPYSQWYSNNGVATATNAWIGWDFGAGNEKDIKEIRVRAGTRDYMHNPSDAVIEYSDDGTTWFVGWTPGYIGEMYNGDTRAFYQNPADRPAAPGLSARYWRGKFSKPIIDATFLRVLDMRLYDDVAGPNLVDRSLATTNAIAGSSYNTSYRPKDAFDTDIHSNSWLADSSLGRFKNWLGWDFGAGISKAVKAIQIKGGNLTVDGPADCAVEKSNDGWNWYPAWDEGPLPRPGEVIAAGGVYATYRDPAERPAPSAAAPAKYWRLLIEDSADSSLAEVAELQFRATPGGADLTSPAEAVAKALGSTTNGSTWGVNKAFDDSTSSRWHSGSTSTDVNSWLGWVFDTAVSVREVSVTGYTSGVNSPGAMKVQRSDDGVQWVTEWSIAAQTGWGNTETRVFTKP